MQHLAHATTRCYGLATRSTHSRLTQRTVKTGISIYRPRRFSITASSPRNDSLLRTALALQQIAHVTTRCYGLATTTRPYQRNVKTGTSIYQRPTDLSCPQRPSSCIQRLDRSQLPATTIQLHSTTRPTLAYQHQTSSCISTTRPTPATLVERPAAHIYNSTIQADDITHLAEDHIQLPRTFTHTFVIPANKIVTLLYVISPSVFLHCLLLSLHIPTHLHTKFICGVDKLIGSATLYSQDR